MSDYLKRRLLFTFIIIWTFFLLINVRHPQAETTSQFLRNKNWILPAEGIISDTFGARDGVHKGIDIAGKLGSNIKAVNSGVVTKSYYSSSYGNVIFIKHDDEEIETVYAHLHKRLVDEGERVKQGDKIGEMGNTGRSSAVNLHFEIHKKEWTYNKSNAIDPALAFANIKIGSKLTYPNRDTVTVMTVNNLPKSEKIKLELLEKNLQYLHENKKVNRTEVGKELLNEEKKIIHNVNEGDTIWSIAKRYDVPVNKIIKENYLESDIIYPNQKITIEKEEQSKRLSKNLLVKKMKQALDERRALQMLK